MPTYLTHFLFSLIPLEILPIKRYSKTIRLSATGLPLSQIVGHKTYSYSPKFKRILFLSFHTNPSLIFCSSFFFLIPFFFALSTCPVLSVFSLNIAKMSLDGKDFCHSYSSFPLLGSLQHLEGNFGNFSQWCWGVQIPIFNIAVFKCTFFFFFFLEPEYDLKTGMNNTKPTIGK